MRLGVIVPRFNPCGYQRPEQNFHRFISGIKDQIRACDYYDSTVLRLRDKEFMWQKESLINDDIRNLPPEYDSVCWIDADLIFENPNWYDDTCRALEHFPVVQMFDFIVYLDRDGHKQAGGYGTVAAQDRSTWRAPGGAIACRRELLTNGIYDRHPLGGGDEIFMDACLGRYARFCERLNPPFKEHVRRWCEAFGQHPPGFVPGTVKHLWHGDRKGRQYVERHQLLAAHDFDPEVDVRIGENGLLEWASDKPALHQAVRDWFLHRQEDG